MPLSPSDLPDEAFRELLDKQLNRYATTAAQLSGYGVQVKTWCVTTVGAVAALAVNNDRSALFAVALGILAVFMFLDVRYLWLERRFKAGAYALIERVEKSEVERLREFFTNRPPPRAERGSVVEILKSFFDLAVLPGDRRSSAGRRRDGLRRGDASGQHPRGSAPGATGLCETGWRSPVAKRL
jgi:hypothetical protein